jgi:hypothetical protein
MRRRSLQCAHRLLFVGLIVVVLLMEESGYRVCGV